MVSLRRRARTRRHLQRRQAVTVMTTDEKRRCTAMGALAREKDTARCRLGAREVYGAQAAASSLSSAPVSEHRLHEAEGRPGNIDCMRPKVADQGGVGLRREEHQEPYHNHADNGTSGKPKRRRSSSSTLPGPLGGEGGDKPRMNHNVKVTSIS